MTYKRRQDAVCAGPAFHAEEDFVRVIQRHKGDAGVRTLNCADLFRVMACAQLTWQESLRDVAVCLAANRAKPFHLVVKNVSARSTLSNALNLRDWCIYHDLAVRMFRQARGLYASERLNLNLNQCGYIPRPLGRPLFDPWAPDTPPLGAGKFIATVYARDATTIDLCLALFEWVPFRRTNAVFKLHKLLDFLLIEAGAFYVIDPGHLTFASAVLHA